MGPEDPSRRTKGSSDIRINGIFSEDKSILSQKTKGSYHKRPKGQEGLLTAEQNVST